MDVLRKPQVVLFNFYLYMYSLIFKFNKLTSQGRFYRDFIKQNYLG